MNMTKKKDCIPNITGSHQMNWRELAEADDLASALTVDPYLGFTTHKMTDMKLRIPDRIKRKFRDIIYAFRKHKCYDTAYNQLTADPNIVKRSWSVDPRFKDHVNRYLLLFDDRSGIEIRPCWRYASENHIGAAIFATRDWSKGSRINTLVGCIAELKHHEEAAFLKHHKNDFSVMYSSRKNCSQLWLGPAAYVNHDCHPNCEFTINCDADARMSLEAKMDIKCGDEIFIYYGRHFFDTNNGACECFTCELLGRGYFSKFNQDVEAKNTTNQRSPSDTISNQGHPKSAMSAYYSNLNTSSSRNHVLCDRMNSLPDNAQSTNWNGSQNSKSMSLDFLLKKGSSTGLACKALPGAYALRHTGSRLNRVKARIMAATVASRNVISQENRKPKINSPYKKCILRRTLLNTVSPCRRSQSDSNPHVTNRRKSRNSLSAVKRRHQPLRNSLSEPQVDNFTPESATKESVSNDPTACDNMTWQESDGTSSGLGQSVHNDDSSGSNSPLPPALDRMSSTSPNNSFSDTTITPDLGSSYYLDSVDQSYSSDNKIDNSINNLTQQTSYMHCRLSADETLNPATSQSYITEENELTKNVEPILGRLISETQCGDIKNLLLTNRPSNQPPVSENGRRRLTNYDARLIAEAKLFTPASKQRIRKPLTYPDSIGYISLRDILKSPKSKPMKCENKRKPASKRSLCSTDYTNPGVHTDSKISNSVRSRQTALCDLTKYKCDIAPTDRRSHQCLDVESLSEDSIPPLLTTPSKIHTTSSFTFSDSSHDVGPPSIYSTAEGDDKSELFSIDSELTEPNVDSESTYDYHFRDTHAYPSNLSQRSTIYDEKNTVLSAGHVLTDHDYSLTAYNAECVLAPNLLISKKINTQNCRQKSMSYSCNAKYDTLLSKVVQTPPPPILQPATPPSTLDLYTCYSPCKIKNDYLSNSSHTPAISRVHNPWWSHTSDPNDMIWHSEVVYSDSIPNTTRLTVTLKRVGPKHYQISQPNGLLIK
ncbi:unnamed protein product [Heterobilharzia americana]|nr:unnamed protein product [Heterobilharzia americana]